MNTDESPTGPATTAGREERRRRLRTAAALVVVGGAVALCWPRTTVVEVLEQPPSISYDDGSVHLATVERTHSLLGDFPIVSIVPDRYTIVLGRDPGSGYGHRIESTLNAEDLDVQWAPDGAWLQYSSGHRTFVPASFFTGGR